MIILLFNSNIFLFILFILLGNHQINSYLSFTYQTSIVLKNHNIFVIHKEGITTRNSKFAEIIKKVYIFQQDEQISTEDKLLKISIKKFNDGYIFCLIIDRIYIFDAEGNYEDRSNSLIPYLIEENLFFTLLPYKIENSYYYYIIGYVYQNYIYLNCYNYKFLGILGTNFNKIYSLDTELMFSISEYKVYGKPISCELFKIDDNPGDTFTCGYYGIIDGRKYFLFDFFYIRDNY